MENLHIDMEKVKLGLIKMSNRNSIEFQGFEQFISMFREKIGRPLKKSEITEISSWWFRGMNCLEAIKQMLERHQDKQSFNYYKANLWRDYNILAGQVYKQEPTNMKAIMQEIAKLPKP